MTNTNTTQKFGRTTLGSFAVLAFVMLFSSGLVHTAYAQDDGGTSFDGGGTSFDGGTSYDGGTSWNTDGGTSYNNSNSGGYSYSSLYDGGTSFNTNSVDGGTSFSAFTSPTLDLGGTSFANIADGGTSWNSSADGGTSFGNTADGGVSFASLTDGGISYANASADGGISYSHVADGGISYTQAADGGISYNTPADGGISYNNSNYGSSGGYGSGGYYGSGGGYYGGGYGGGSYYGAGSYGVGSYYGSTYYPSNNYPTGGGYNTYHYIDNSNYCNGVNNCNTNITNPTYPIVTTPSPTVVYNNNPGSVYYSGSTYTAPLYATNYSQVVAITSGTINPNPSLSLTSIPYTGLELGFWGTIFYWGFLIFWCLLAAYLVAVKRVQNTLIAFLFGGEIATEPQQNPVAEPATSEGSAQANHAHAFVVHAPVHVAETRGDAIDSFIMSQINRRVHA